VIGTPGSAVLVAPLHSRYDLLGRLTNSKITAGEGDNDILAAPTYDSAGHQLSTSATKAGATTASTFTLNPLDEQVAETRSEGGTPISWAKTNTDPAGNPTDRCVWNTNPGSELCKAVGQTFHHHTRGPHDDRLRRPQQPDQPGHPGRRHHDL
jgi:hypothetical protein